MKNKKNLLLVAIGVCFFVGILNICLGFPNLYLVTIGLICLAAGGYIGYVYNDNEIYKKRMQKLIDDMEKFD